MSVTITFLGGASTVTGSKYLVQHEGQKLLVDCGLFQGYKQLRLRNWNPPTFEPKEINAVVLTQTTVATYRFFMPKAIGARYMPRPPLVICARFFCQTVGIFKKRMQAS